jgi:hypothetical protein
LSKTQEVRFRFAIRNEDPTATEADIRKRLKKATKKALEEADKRTVEASTELEGGFFGIGEAAVILFVVHAVEAGAAAAALGAATAAGKDFYENVLKKQLLKVNLLPSKFKTIPPKPAPAEQPQLVVKPEEAEPREQVAAKKAAPKKTAKKKSVAKKQSAKKLPSK